MKYILLYYTYLTYIIFSISNGLEKFTFHKTRNSKISRVHNILIIFSEHNLIESEINIQKCPISLSNTSIKKIKLNNVWIKVIHSKLESTKS